MDKQSQSKPVHSSSSNEIGSLCSSIVSVFEDCLAKDEHQYVHQCLQIAQNILERNNGKVSTLYIKIEVIVLLVKLGRREQ